MLSQYLHDSDELRHAQLALAQSLYWSGDYPPARKLYAEVLHPTAHEVQARATRCRSVRRRKPSRDWRVFDGRKTVRRRQWKLLRQAYEGEMKCWGPVSYTRIQQAFLEDALVAMGKTKEGLALLEPAEAEWRRPPVNKSRSFTALKYLGYAYVESRRFPEAERVLRDAFELLGKYVAPGNKRAAGLQLLWARAPYGEGKYREALGHAEAADRVILGPAEYSARADERGGLAQAGRGPADQGRGKSVRLMRIRSSSARPA